jgi:dTDP-4-amino-4,6-dideoxygalactose transaminase
VASFLPFALPDTGEEEVHEVVDSLRSGWIATGPRTRRFGKDFESYLGDGVQAIAPGCKYNLTDLAAATGIHKLWRADAFQRRREALAVRYDAALDRDAVVSRMYAAGIGSSVHCIPLHQQPCWKDRYPLESARSPYSKRLFERGFSRPLYTRKTDADQRRVIDALRASMTT